MGSLSQSSIYRPTSLVVSHLGFEGLGYDRSSGGGTGSGSVSANLALYVPIELLQPSTFLSAMWCNGATLAGNVELGVYTDDWSLITSTGAVAQAGASTAQRASMTSFTLRPGRYYIAFVSSSATATFIGHSVQQSRWSMLGVSQEVSAMPLPATATPSIVTSAFVPQFGFSRRDDL